MLAAADFFTVEVWGHRSLVTFYVFFVIELESRKIEIAGITPGPSEPWMMQIGRNLTDPLDGFLSKKKHLILDRDSKYSATFQGLLKGAGVEVVRLPHRSPNLNAYAERFVRSIKDECLNRMIFFGERSLRKATREFTAHYHTERNHQRFKSSDPDTGRVWWNEAGVNQNLTFPVQPDPVSGMHCWHQRVVAEKADAADCYGDIFVDTNQSREIYREWLARTRPAPGPGNLGRPRWLNRPLHPAPETYELE